MKSSFLRIVSFVLFFAYVNELVAQNLQCNYTLELFDNTGDGWNNGARVAVTIGSSTNFYTLDNFNDDGLYRKISLSLNSGDSLRLAYFSGGIQDIDNGFRLSDSEGMLLFEDGPFPKSGMVYQTVADCPSCRLPDITSIRLAPVRSGTALITWNPSVTPGVYLIRLKNETPGAGGINEFKVNGNEYQIQGLQELTTYSFTLSVICSIGDTSLITNPITFTTRRANDVGVSAILSPISSCNLGTSEKIEITLKNYGGLPQALFEYKYGVNDEEVNINVPFDGFYTGVLGMDSTYNIEFDQRYDFSKEGLYVIKAWTELETDSQQENDTFTYRLMHIPEIKTFPYFTDLEEWESGWTSSSLAGVSSWEYGNPVGGLIKGAASGKQAWVTNLAGRYQHKEESYIYSPCLDFGGLMVDPIFSFSLFLDTESGFDFLWLEGSLDGGLTWAKIGSHSGGVNWYNNLQQQAWSGQDVYPGWVYVAHPLQGFAGQKTVRLRFVFKSDVFIAGEGVGLDNFAIHTPFGRDAAALSLTNQAEGTCGSASDRVKLTFVNMGNVRITSISAGYQIEGQTQVTENVVGLSVNPGQRYTHTFSSIFNSNKSGDIAIKGWVSLIGEENRRNDTINYVFPASRGVPFIENFEETDFLAGWTFTEGARITPFHQNTSRVLAFNLYRDDPVYQMELPQIGPISSMDSFTFDYRLSTYASGGAEPFIPGMNDVIRILVSEDCGITYQELFQINQSNHQVRGEMRRIRLSLAAYAGKAVIIKIEAVWGQGDYWFDIDEVGVFGCPVGLGLQFEVTGVSIEGGQDGKIVLNPTKGTPPYSFFWNNGSVSKNLVGVAAGVYQVNVVDYFGCSDNGQINLGLISGVRNVAMGLESFHVMPNPSNGNLTIEIEFEDESRSELIIYSSAGQIVTRFMPESFRQKRYQIDLTGFDNGLYHISLRTMHGIVTRKVILLK
jgi:hypothetical protein